MAITGSCLYKFHRCKEKSWGEQFLPRASVVICFYNEAMSALMRTLHTVIARTPSHLLEEIVLVDDKSDLPHLQQHLEFTLSQDLPQVKLIRTKEREGLIRARILGAEHARAEVRPLHCYNKDQQLEFYT